MPMRTDSATCCVAAHRFISSATFGSLDELTSYKSGWLHFGYINRQPYVSLFFRLALTPHTSQQHNFRVDRQIYSYISLFDMVQIKLSVAFILAAAAIAPVVALPAPKGGAST